MEIIGQRWAGTILQVMLAGAERFSEIEASIPSLSRRMLSLRLKQLEAEAIVRRVVIPTMPVRVEYQLTEKGRALAPAVAALVAWADEWIAPPASEALETHARHAAAARTAVPTPG